MNPIKIKHAAALMAIGTTAYGFAAGDGQTFSITPLGNVGGASRPAAQSAAADSGETVKVQGCGIGVDKTAALKDAYRDAIERAVGLYVDAEQMIKNDELVKDQILTQSNAYIAKYDVMKEDAKVDGLVELQILAEVRKIALTRKISEVMPAKTFRLGDDLQNAHAKMTTAERRNVDGATLLANALEGLNPYALSVDCSLASNESVVREWSRQRGAKNTVDVNYLFRTEINQQRFFENVVPKLQAVLTQISLAEPREVTIPIRIGDIVDRRRDVVDVDSLVARGKQSPQRLKYETGERAANCSASYADLFGTPKNTDAVGFFVLVTGGNKFRTSYSGFVYELDEASAKVVDSWTRTLKSPIEFTVSLIDAPGETIFGDKIAPPYAQAVTGCVSRFGIRRDRTRKDRVRRYTSLSTIVAPWRERHGADGIAFEDFWWHEFALPKDALPEVKGMKIEIVQ